MEFQGIVFYPWHTRLLLTTSLAFLWVGKVALSYGKVRLAAIFICLWVTSITYWYSPTLHMTWRKAIDMCMVLVAFTYVVFFEQPPLVIVIVSLLSGAMSYKWAFEGDERWIWAHATLHLTGSCVALLSF
jgi:hypothetical protein